MHKLVITLIGLLFLSVNSVVAITLDSNKICDSGANNKCRIVDVIDVTETSSGIITEVSTKNVYSAWKSLTLGNGCKDVADVVVGGTLAEDGAPESPYPGEFAEHLIDPYDVNNNSCTIVVNYYLGFYPDNYFDTSVEVGRRALSAILNKLDSIRRGEGKSGVIRVWGLSKGAAIVESVWTIEARDSSKTLVSDIPSKIYMDACPSNQCYYMGFGYPYFNEQGSTKHTSRKTAGLWMPEDTGYMKQPDSSQAREYKRLTTFTNYSDPVYSCSKSTKEDFDNAIEWGFWYFIDKESASNNADWDNCFVAPFHECHGYGKLLREARTYGMDAWGLDRYGLLGKKAIRMGYKGDNYCGK